MPNLGFSSRHTFVYVLFNFACFKAACADDTCNIRRQFPTGNLPLHYVFVKKWFKLVGWDVLSLRHLFGNTYHRLSTSVITVIGQFKASKRHPQHWRRECRCSRHQTDFIALAGFRVARLARLGFGFQVSHVGSVLPSPYKWSAICAFRRSNTTNNRLHYG